ncbi:MAG: N-acetylmuramoyl-L-alanine amidase [Alphaproteobacteria bacterium]
MAAAWPARAAAPTVIEARIGIAADGTRFVIEATEALPYRIFTLADPYRVVIDLPEVDWRVPATPMNASVGVVANYRYGLFKPGHSRIVLDLTVPATISRHFAMTPAGGSQHRLVIDLAPIDDGSFRQAISKVVTRGWSEPGPLRDAPEAVGRSAPTPVPAPDARSGRRTVVIDAGHGGVDPGAIGASGTYEKHVTLAVAQAVKRTLERTGRYRVVLTRDNDVYVPLRERYQRAETAGAELFLSLHADSIDNSVIRGSSVYSLSEQASDREAEALATKENRSDVIAGVDLSNQSDAVASFLISLRQRETMNESAVFAQTLIGELKDQILVLRNTHRFAGFAVLKSPDVPSVLVELGYLSNRRDEKELNTDTFRSRVGQAVLRAADAYFARKDRLSRS